VVSTSARLLRLLALLQAPRDWSGTELAERLEVNVRTVRRDVDRLRALGYVVHSVPGAAGYRLAAGTRLPPLLLDADEAVAVAVGLRTAAGGTIGGIEESSLRALSKLEQVLPSRLRHRVSALHAATVALPAGTATADPEALTAIAVAIRDRNVLRFHYRSHDGTEDRRAAEPYRLVHTGRHWYLLGWDTERTDWRTFRVDRMQLRTPNGPRFRPREEPDPGDAVALGVTTAVYRYQARITLKVPATVAAEQISPSAGVIEVVDENSCVLRTGANSLNELAVHIGLLGCPFEVHEPVELVEALRDLARRIEASVGRGQSGAGSVQAGHEPRTLT
jgi:predicted DNA-binding transcriptional regulator YafY